MNLVLSTVILLVASILKIHITTLTLVLLYLHASDAVASAVISNSVVGGLWMYLNIAVLEEMTAGFGIGLARRSGLRLNSNHFHWINFITHAAIPLLLIRIRRKPSSVDEYFKVVAHLGAYIALGQLLHGNKFILDLYPLAYTSRLNHYTTYALLYLLVYVLAGILLR